MAFSTAAKCMPGLNSPHIILGFKIVERSGRHFPDPQFTIVDILSLGLKTFANQIFRYSSFGHEKYQ